MSTVRCRYEKGVLRPVGPVELPFDEGQELDVDISAPSGLMTELPALTEDEERKLARKQLRAIRRFRGVIKDGPSDLSTRVDEILYGESRFPIKK